MNARFQNLTRGPITWRYGAIASGVALTQGLGLLWYSPNALGSVWGKDVRLTASTKSSEDMQINLILNTVADTGLAFLLQYLSDRYFRPVTVQDAFLFATLIGLVHVLPQTTHVLWGKRSLSGFLIDHTYNILGIFIKVLCLQNISR